MRVQQKCLSARAEDRLAHVSSELPRPTGPYFDSDLHPEGCINLSTAENTLLSKEITQILQQGKIKSQHLKYRTALLRSSITQLADLLPRYISRCHPIRPVTRDNTVLGPGVGALLAPLVWTICNEDEGVLLSAPFYHDYARDIIYPAKAKPVLANLPPNVDPLSPSVIAILRERMSSSADEGHPIRCLILCNPHNPIPHCYPVETIRAYVKLAQEFSLHLIVDEIFANSTFATADDPDPTPFTSILSMNEWAADSPMVQRIHVLGGPTKDLGCSGIKAGVLVTENKAVRQSVAAALQATPISGITDAALSEVLRDEARLGKLLAANRMLLGEAMDLCAAWCRFHEFDYVGATSGVFFILDLSPVAAKLGLQGVKAVAGIMERMLAQRVHINPTMLDLDPHPCRFRFIFSHPRDVLTLAFRRLESAFGLPAAPTPQASRVEGEVNGHA